MSYNEKYQNWLAKCKDEDLKKELLKIKNDQKEKENRFYKDLEFGTGGLRGIIGAGTNCLNIYTIRKASKGLCDYIKEIGGKSVAISYDSRINSQLFAENTAMVFAENNIKAYLVKELMPTPFLSFAVRRLKTAAGVMVTASHNPSKYNGYKVYGNDGCQITDIFAKKVTEQIEKIDGFEVEVANFEKCLKNGLIEYINDKITEEFLEQACKYGLEQAENLKVCYTPLNGTGYKLVPQILNKKGVKDIVIVKEQQYPDGNFTTCPYPNPEKEEAVKLALKYAKENNCDIMLATDPDADRVGLAVNNGKDFIRLTGNETGILLAQYLLSNKKKKGILPKNPIIIKTIVTSSLINKIAKEYNGSVIDVLTGFKYIGEQIGLLEQKGEEERFILGFEESYGYLAGGYVRDKDAVGACMLIAEMASFYKKQGKTLLQVLNELYTKYGKYTHKLISKEFAGASGFAKMKELLLNIRKENLKEINGLKVINVIDYLTQTEKDLPKSNVLTFDLENDAQLIIRPSGTEPLIKFYLTAALTDKENEKIFKSIEDFINNFFK